MVMDILEKWMQDNHLQDPDDIDTLLEAADLIRQLIQEKNYEGICTIINFTIKNGSSSSISILPRRDLINQV